MNQKDQVERGDESTQAHPFLTFGLVLAGVASLAYLIGRLLQRGDEAPIRVRGGSIYLDLLGKQTWKRTGNHWRVSGGTRGHDDYALMIAAKAGCSYDGTRKARIRIIHSDNKSISIRSEDRHTRVDSDSTLRLSNNDRTLSYENEGYVSAIELDGHLVCAFAPGDFEVMEADD